MSRCRAWTCLAAAMTLAGMASAQTVFYYRFEEGAFLSDETGQFPLTQASGATQVPTPFPDPVPHTGAANGAALDLDGAGHVWAADSPDFSPAEFSLELSFEADAFNPSVDDALVSHYAFSGVNDRSWWVAENGGVLSVLISPDGEALHNFPSTLNLETGRLYTALLRVRIDPVDGAEVQWAWRDITAGTNRVIEPVQLKPALVALHNSTAPLRIGAVTKAGVADNFWNGRLDEIRWTAAWLDDVEWLDMEGPTPFADYMDWYFPGVGDPDVVGPEADPDEDTISNEREYWFGTNPNSPDNTGAPTLSLLGDYGVYRFRRLCRVGLSRYRTRFWTTLLPGSPSDFLSATPVVVDSLPGLPSHEEVELYFIP